MDIENKLTEAIDLWQEGTGCPEDVLNCLLVIPVVCMQPISCLCKIKYMSMRCKCSKESLKCTPACRFDVIGFPNFTFST